MGYILLQLITRLLQGFKLVGDITIWLFKTQVLAIIFLAKYTVQLLKLPSILLNTLLSRFSVYINTLKSKTSHSSRSKSLKKQPSIGHKINQAILYSMTILKPVKYFFFGFIVASIILGGLSSYYVLSKDLPHPELLTRRDIPLTTKIYDRNGELLYEIYADQNRTPVALNELPDYFVDATIAIEDRGFYRHQGFSPRGIVRAAYNITVLDELQGGSTITQQLIRSALLNHDITISRKIRELILSFWTEQIYSKEEILSMYFNQVPYGGTAWGAEAAAQTYFQKSIRDVTLAESALLAGLPAAPTRFSPFGSHPELALRRQKEVLLKMQEEGFITEEQRKQAEQEKISFARSQIGIRAPHFVMYVREVLNERYGPRMVEQGGLTVVTSLDLSLQNKLQSIVAEEVSQLSHLNVGNGAALVSDPTTGEILAMIGSTDYYDLENDGNVNLTLAKRQPGSTIKAITYAAALQNGFTAATLIQDAPITYASEGSQPYSPVNYDRRFHGYVPLRDALGNSYNIPAVRTLAKIGIPTLIEQGQRMGIDSWKNTNQYGLSLTLGGGETTMLEMAQAYGVLANKGKLQKLNPIMTIADHRGTIIEDNTNSTGEQVVPEEVAFIISDILSDNSARTASFGPTSELTIPESWVAVKTGTSDNKRDNWAIGYTPDFVVASWVGNNDNTPMHPTLASGVTGATPIWRSITEQMLEIKPSRKPTRPTNVVSVSCRGGNEYFIQDTVSANECRPIPQPTPKKEEDTQTN